MPSLVESEPEHFHCYAENLECSILPSLVPTSRIRQRRITNEFVHWQLTRTAAPLEFKTFFFGPGSDLLVKVINSGHPSPIF